MTATAVDLYDTFGKYPMATMFTSNDNTTMNAPKANDDFEALSKRHAACDECRKRKLKCSGEPSGCTRCVKHNLACLYSPQKQMGRPKKRQRTEDSMQQTISAPPYHLDPNLTSADIERTNFENICPGSLAQSIRRNDRPSAASLSQASGSLTNTPPSDHPRTPPDTDFTDIAYPTDYSLWPDFSDTVLPLPMQDKWGADDAGTLSGNRPTVDPDADPSSLASLPTVPECPCLPNLYLTLSTLSTLSTWPINTQTITTLSSSHLTAHNVIYCRICPQRFQTGSQNVMLASTLLNVLTDQWHRVLKASAVEIRNGFSNTPIPSNSTMSRLEDLEWRTFAYDIVRYYVFGDRSLPTSPTSSLHPTSQAITLASLADSMERRQRQWHGHEPATGEFGKKMSTELECGKSTGLTLEDIRKLEKEKEAAQAAKGEANTNAHLCLQLARHAKDVMNILNRDVPRLGP